MKLKERNVTTRYAIVQAMYWMSFCLVFTYSSVYLLDKGLTNTQIGLVIGISGGISAILQPLTGGVADKKGTAFLRILIVALGGTMILMAVGLLTNPGSRLLVVLLYGGLVVVLQILTPLVYSLGMECVNQGNPLNFGLARGVGSLSFALISYVAGKLVAAYGTSMIPIMVVGIYGLFMASIYCFRYQGVNSKEKECVSIHTQEKEAFFSKYYRFSLLLLGAVLIFASHNMINNFAYQIIESKGGDSSAMGITMALAAAWELPTMFFFTWMVKKAESGTWLKVSGVFFSLKALATLLVVNVTGMYLIQALQAFGFGLFVVSSVYYVNTIMDKKDRVKGQAYMTMTNTLGGVIGSLLGGMMIDKFGMTIMLMFSTGIAIVGTGVMGISAKKRK